MLPASISVMLFPLLLSIAPSHVFTHTTATASLQQQQSIAHALAALEAEVEQFHAQQHHTQQQQPSDEGEDIDQEDKQQVIKPEHVIDPPPKCMVNINGTHVEIGSLLTAYNHPDLTAIAQFCGTAENLYSVVKAVDPQLEHQLTALTKNAFKGVRDWSKKAKQAIKQWQQKPHWFNNYQGLNEKEDKTDKNGHFGLGDDEDSRDDKRKPILLLFKKKSSTVITPKSTPENKKLTEDYKPIQLGGDEDVLNQESDVDLLGGEDGEPGLDGPNDGFGADVPEGFDGPNAPYESDEQDETDINPDEQPIDLQTTHEIQNPISTDLTPKLGQTNAATALKPTTTAPVQNTATTPVKQTSAAPVAPMKVEAKESNTVKTVGKGQDPVDTKAKTLSALSLDDDQPKQDNRPKNKLVQLGEAIKVNGIKQKNQEGIANLLANKQNDDSLDEVEESPRLPVEIEISDDTVNTPPVVDREADETTIDGGLSQDTVTKDILDKAKHVDEAQTDDAELQDDKEDDIDPYSENQTANDDDTFSVQHSNSPQSPQRQKLYELKAAIEDILYELKERYLSLQQRFVSLYETMKQRVYNQ